MTEKIKAVTGKSWRTTSNALIAALMIVLPQLQKLVDVDPENLTSPDWAVVVAAAFGFIAFWNARDHKVSSEEAGALKAPEVHQ